MIGMVTVKISVAHPDIPLRAVPVFAGSAMTIGVVDVPRYFGGVAVTGVSVSVANADGATSTVMATRSGCMWVATFGGEVFATPGHVANGLTITLHGTEEDGETQATWTAGKGDVWIMSSEAVPGPGMSWQNVHLRDSVPQTPQKGDMAFFEYGWKIYTGTEWSAIGGSAPVQTVNGKTGAVVLTGDDINVSGAMSTPLSEACKAFQQHMDDFGNPHHVTAAAVGALGVNVEPDFSRTASYLVAQDETTEAALFINAEMGVARLAVGTTPDTYGQLAVGNGADGHGYAAIGKMTGKIRVGEDGGDGAVEIDGTFSDGEDVREDGFSGAIRVRGKDAYIEVGGHMVATDEQVDEAKSELNARIDLIEATTRPNMNIVGSPKFNQGVVSGFSANDYLMFPTQVNVGQNEVYFYMSFTTGADVTTQQNLLDSWCGLAFAIQNGRAITAASSNGTTFETVESYDQVFEPNSSYRLILRFGYLPYPDGMEYVLKTLLASGSGEYEEISQEVFIGGPLHQTATYWGGANPQSGVHHIFGGTINLNECRMVWNGTEVWRGYDELPTVKFDPTAEPRLDTAEKIVAHIMAQFDNGETEEF